jgi:hypothetical protein
VTKRLGVLSAGPWGREAAAGTGVGAGLIVLPGRSFSEIRFCPLSSELGTTRDAERGQREWL